MNRIFHSRYERAALLAAGFLVCGVYGACSNSSSTNTASGGAAGKGGSSGSGATGGNPGGSSTGGKTGGTAGSTGGTNTGGTVGATGGTAGTPSGSVLEYHNHATRDGLYTDPAFTKTAAAGLHRDSTFQATIAGPTYAQPLYLANGPGGKSVVIAATEQNQVYALDASTGAAVWQQKLGTPVPRTSMPCGNIDPYGITGTGVIDLATRTLFVSAMTTPDGGLTKKYMIFALDVDTGTTKTGWPVDVSTVTAGSVTFNSKGQGQRGALLLLNGTLYVPYGGLYGDCDSYHGWVVGVPIDNPSAPKAYATLAAAGGIWAPGGVSSDGTSIFATTGNTMGATTWADGEAVLKLQPGPVFSRQTTDYFTPSNWKTLDNGDTDLGGSGPLVVDVAGATPSQLLIALGKNGVAYLVNRANLGGIGTGNGTTGEGVDSAAVASNQIINGAASYTTATATYVVFKGNGVGCPTGAGGNLTAIKISATAPPKISVAWCAQQNGGGSPMVTTTDGTSQAIVWGLGAEQDNRLHGFDGDTGQVVYNGGGTGDAMANVRRFQTPIVAGGRIFVAGDNAVYAFTTQ